LQVVGLLIFGFTGQVLFEFFYFFGDQDALLPQFGFAAALVFVQ
jgi:hypothetical protein